MLSSWEAPLIHMLPAPCRGPSALQHPSPCLPLHGGGLRLSSLESAPVPKQLWWQQPWEKNPVGEVESTGGPGSP